MALIAVSFTVEIFLLIIAIYFGFDSGLIRKLCAVGMCFFGIPLVLAPQFYVSDLTTKPTTVSTTLPGTIQNALSIMFIFVAVAVIASALIDIRKMNKEPDKEKVIDYIV